MGNPIPALAWPASCQAPQQHRLAGHVKASLKLLRTHAGCVADLRDELGGRRRRPCRACTAVAAAAAVAVCSMRRLLMRRR